MLKNTITHVEVKLFEYLFILSEEAYLFETSKIHKYFLNIVNFLLQ